MNDTRLPPDGLSHRPRTSRSPSSFTPIASSAGRLATGCRVPSPRSHQSAGPGRPGLSQAELAKLVGGSDARQISRYENGRITPSLDATIRIAEALNISLDLPRHREHPTPPPSPRRPRPSRPPRRTLRTRRRRPPKPPTSPRRLPHPHTTPRTHPPKQLATRPRWAASTRQCHIIEGRVLHAPLGTDARPSRSRHGPIRIIVPMRPAAPDDRAPQARPGLIFTSGSSRPSLSRTSLSAICDTQRTAARHA